MTQVILFNKPFQVLCQFSPHEGKTTLKQFISREGFYPCGRLDYDSEGLLILSDNGSLQSLISQPKHKMAKTYVVQVEGQISVDAVETLSRGVLLKDGMTRPAQCRIIEEPTWVWARTPPIRERKQIPTSWISITITEGKNRQVRRMTAAVGYPTLRLIRYQIGPWTLDNLAPGQWRNADLPKNLSAQLGKPRHTNASVPRRPRRSI